MKRAHAATNTVVTDPYNYVVPASIRSDALSGDTSITLTATIIYFDVQSPVSGVLFVKYGDIYHVEHRYPPHVSTTAIEEIELYLLDGSTCLIEVECSYRLSLCITDLWHARLVQKSMKFKQMKNSTNKDLCMQYYYEILSSIRETATIDNIIEVLDEVGKEIQSDMTLKEVVFQSIDLVLLSLHLIQDLLSIVPVQANKYVEDMRLRDLYPFGLKGVSSHMLENMTLTDELQATLQATIGKRLKLIQKLLQFLLSLFFGAETLTCRSGVLLGPSPLDGNSWNALLAPDLYKVIFKAFGGEDKDDGDDMENAELFADPFAKFQSSYSKGGGVYLKAQPPSPSVHSKQTSAFPRNEELVKSLVLSNPKNAKSNELIIKELPALRKSIRSMQMKLFYDLYEVQQNDKALAVPRQIILADKHPIDDPMIIQSKEHSKAGKLKAYVSIGSLFTKSLNWENAVESFITEIADDLDQVMNKVQTKKSSKALHTRPNTLESGSFLPKITNSPRLNGQKESLVSEAVEVEDYDYNIAHFCVPRMFCITEVLHSLALDSFQVREVLGKDVKAMWTSINSVFSALCDAKDLSKANSLLSPPPSMSAKGSFKLRETRQNSALLPPISSTYASDVLNNSTEFMRSSYSSIKNSLVTDSMSHFGRESRHIDPSKILSKPQHFRSIEERNQMFPHVPFPKHGFNKYEWTLIMEARNNVLKTMQLVGVRLFNQSNNQNFEVLQTASTDDQENGEEEDVLVLDSPRQLALPQNAPSEDKTTKSQDRLDNNIENSTPRDDVNATVNNVNL